MWICVASFSPRLIEDDKGDGHLDALYNWLCPVTWLEQASYGKKSHHGTALVGYVVQRTYPNS
jgi:hypothetical protein